MRPDMAKVIVERPRPGSSRHVPRRFARLDPKRIPLTDDDCDPFPSRLGHRRAARLAGDCKRLNENLTPLRRFLFKQVGRPWDKVWSEISAHVRAHSTVQQHVRDHIRDFVADRTFLKDGQVLVASRRFGGPRPLTHFTWVALYVDPRTGLLCRNKAYHKGWSGRGSRTPAEAQRLAERLRVLASDRQLHLLADGNWWEVTLALETPPRPGEAPPVDVVERAGLSTLVRASRYDRRGVYAVAKRPLCRKEIKARGLRPQLRP